MLLLNFKVVLNVFILLKCVPFAYYGTSIERILKQNEKSFWYDQIKGEKKSCLQEGFFFFLLGNDNEKKSPWSIS